METELPLVSILIPCFNAEPWIQQSIQSALDQSYPNKEVIVIDDGSSDKSVEILEKFGPRIVFRSSPHAGGNAVRHELTQLSKGEWLQFLDADDYLLPGKIASQVDLARLAAPNIAVIYSPVIIHDEARPGADYPIEIEGDDDLLSFIRWAPFCTSGLLLRREAVLRVGSWKIDQPCCQEHELLSRLLTAGYRFALHNKPETVYRKHGSATVSRRDPLRTIRLRMEITDRVAEHLKASGALTQARRKALYVARLESARSAASGDFELSERLSRKAMSLGHWWVSNSPALPPGYQIIFRLLGFRRTERIAAWVQAQKQSHGNDPESGRLAL